MYAPPRAFYHLGKTSRDGFYEHFPSSPRPACGERARVRGLGALALLEADLVRDAGDLDQQLIALLLVVAGRHERALALQVVEVGLERVAPVDQLGERRSRARPRVVAV